MTHMYDSYSVCDRAVIFVFDLDHVIYLDFYLDFYLVFDHLCLDFFSILMNHDLDFDSCFGLSIAPILFERRDCNHVTPLGVLFQIVLFSWVMVIFLYYNQLFVLVLNLILYLSLFGILMIYQNNQ